MASMKKSCVAFEASSGKDSRDFGQLSRLPLALNKDATLAFPTQQQQPMSTLVAEPVERAPRKRRTCAKSIPRRAHQTVVADSRRLQTCKQTLASMQGRK
jgi:hypothetical protein